MSNFPPQPPRRLVRSTSNRVVGGVCGGVADYLNMDANLVRLLTVLISLFTGVPVILYIIALFVMPEDDTARSTPPPVAGPSYSGPFSAGSATPPPAYAPYPPAAGASFPPAAQDPVWGREGPPWEQQQPEPTSAAAPAAADSTPTAAPVAPAEPEAPIVPPEDPRRGGSPPA